MVRSPNYLTVVVPQTEGTIAAYAVGIPPDITFGDNVKRIRVISWVVELYESRGILEVYDSSSYLLSGVLEVLGVSQSSMVLGVESKGKVSGIGVDYLLFTAVDQSLGVRGQSVTVLDLVYVYLTSNERSTGNGTINDVGIWFVDEGVFPIGGCTAERNDVVVVL